MVRFITFIKEDRSTVDKFIGDAIMALFGAPVSYEDNCRRAVAAAYEMPEDKAALLMKERCIDLYKILRKIGMVQSLITQNRKLYSKVNLLFALHSQKKAKYLLYSERKIQFPAQSAVK